MLRFILVFCYCIFGYVIVNAQQFPSRVLIEKWSRSDTAQTRAAEETYDDLRLHADKARFDKLIPDLEQRIGNRGSKRLKIRLLMYEILGRTELGAPTLVDQQQRIIDAIAMANKLEDNQLLSEIYSLYANILPVRETEALALLYRAKAVEMQERIGAIHFPKIYLRYLENNMSLYRIGEYAQAVRMGLHGLEDQKRNNIVSVERLLQYDYIASCYKQMQKGDSVLYYYREAQRLVRQWPTNEKDSIPRKIWEGVIAGGIGQGYFLQQQYATAIPLLYQNIQSSTLYGVWSDAATAQNTLAEIFFRQGQYELAAAGWKNANHWSILDRDLNNRVNALMGLSKTYRILNRPDSAYYYYDTYILYKDSLNKRLNANLQTLTQTQVSFDDLQYSLKASLEHLTRERLLRNGILITIALLATIVLLLFKQKNLRAQMVRQTLEEKNKQASREIKESRHQIEQFKQSIIEKNQLITELEQRSSGQAEAVLEKLTEYSLVTEEKWAAFRMEISKAYPGFYAQLQQKIGRITPAEERLLTLLYLKLDNYQIANALGISKDSVARSKRRLKQRLELGNDEELETYIAGL